MRRFYQSVDLRSRSQMTDSVSYTHLDVYKRQVYTIGEKVFANGTSDYHGLVGHIYEIRDGEDKETENDGPDFYCSFDAPVSPDDIKRFEQYFSDLYGTKKSLEDIALDLSLIHI